MEVSASSPEILATDGDRFFPGCPLHLLKRSLLFELLNMEEDQNDQDDGITAEFRGAKSKCTLVVQSQLPDQGAVNSQGRQLSLSVVRVLVEIHLNCLQRQLATSKDTGRTGR